MDNKNNAKRKRILKVMPLVTYLTSLLTLLVIALFIMIEDLYVKIDETQEGFNKKEMQSALKTVIKNGGDLDNVKHIFKSSKLQKNSILDILLRKDKELYAPSTSLSSILNDLQIIYYTNPSADSTYLIKLEQIIQEEIKKNPFDNLEENQKYYFENIQLKLGNNYNLINEDVRNISEELKTKNDLVKRYLNKSESSFYISIIAFVAALVMAIYQIYLGYKGNKKINESINNQMNLLNQKIDAM